MVWIPKQLQPFPSMYLLALMRTKSCHTLSPNTLLKRREPYFWWIVRAVANGCENHDVKLGCTWLGEGAGKVDLSKWPGARLATQEEALERERLAFENGLVPHMGKLRSDAVLYDVLDYEHKFMSICHCCSCCCVVALMKYGPSDYRKFVKRMDGVKVEVNRDICVGCGECFKVCIYDALKMKGDRAMIKQENCLGCGRCERTCPNGAISISLDGYSNVDELFARFDSRVDISTWVLTTRISKVCIDDGSESRTTRLSSSQACSGSLRHTPNKPATRLLCPLLFL